MKTNLSILIYLISFCSFTAVAQHNTEPDERLFKRFNEKQIQSMQEGDGFEIAWQNWIVNNSYYFRDISQVKNYQDIPYLKTFDYLTKQKGDVVEISNFDNFNIYQYYFKRGHRQQVSYKIKNSDKIIFFHSYSYLTKEYNKLRNEK